MAKLSRIKNSSHPGGFVRMMVVEPLNLKVTQAAKALGVTRPVLSNFLNENASLSPEMAIRIEKAFGVDMETLMRMQTNYDIGEARKRQNEIKVAPFLAGGNAAPRAQVPNVRKTFGDKRMPRLTPL